MIIDIPTPDNNILPSLYADKLGIHYTLIVSIEHKKKLGQFFTPWKIARFMAKYCIIKSEKISILDPGCGIGILACSVIERLLELNNKIREIELRCFETDNQIIVYSDACLRYLHKWLEKKKVNLTYFLCKNDFITHNSALLEKNDNTREEYDIIITNPPYFKLNKKEAITEYAKSIVYKQTNVYSVFVLLSTKLLSRNGQLIFITPRSFASGSYFQLFREKLFESILITNIHLFESRRRNFDRDKVLQENVIISCVKKEEVLPSQLELNFKLDSNNVKITTSEGIVDAYASITQEYNFESLVNLNSSQKILHIPISKRDENAIQVFKSWSKSLEDYEIRVSTGPVVNFRNAQFIKDSANENCVPLISLAHTDKMQLTWPLNKKIKGKYTGEYIQDNIVTKSVLIENKDYILLRRFSTKEDTSRLVATPYFADVLSRYNKIGIENHVNYIYRPMDILKKEETIGIAAILNSKLFDIYFRTFNGSINVSATELRNIPFPELSIVKEIGQSILNSKCHDQIFIDAIVAKYFKIHFD